LLRRAPPSPAPQAGRAGPGVERPLDRKLGTLNGAEGNSQDFDRFSRSSWRLANLADDVGAEGVEEEEEARFPVEDDNLPEEDGNFPAEDGGNFPVERLLRGCLGEPGACACCWGCPCRLGSLAVAGWFRCMSAGCEDVRVCGSDRVEGWHRVVQLLSTSNLP